MFLDWDKKLNEESVNLVINVTNSDVSDGEIVEPSSPEPDIMEDNLRVTVENNQMVQVNIRSPSPVRTVLNEEPTETISVTIVPVEKRKSKKKSKRKKPQPNLEHHFEPINRKENQRKEGKKGTRRK